MSDDCTDFKEAVASLCESHGVDMFVMLVTLGGDSGLLMVSGGSGPAWLAGSDVLAAACKAAATACQQDVNDAMIESVRASRKDMQDLLAVLRGKSARPEDPP